MTVRIIRSTDLGAPVLTGQVGKLLDILDACLVNGLAPWSITSITRVGGVATATTSSPHGMAIGSIGHRLTIAGAVQADYNVVDAAVTPTAADQFTYAVANAPATPATGTITATKAGAGWTKPFSGTNTAAYKQPAGSNGFYLNVDDTGTSSARVRGFETMTAPGVGTGPFPTEAQVSGGLYAIKSQSVDALARAWVFATNGTVFHFGVATGVVGSASWAGSTMSSVGGSWMSFGDAAALASGDAFATVLIANTGSTYQTGQHANLGTGLTGLSGHYAARSYTQLGASVAVGKHGDNVKGSGTSGIGNLTYPNPVDGGFYIAPIWVTEPAVVRGVLPGVWGVCHSVTSTVANGTPFDGQGSTAGRVFELVSSMNGSGVGAIALELSDTW